MYSVLFIANHEFFLLLKMALNSFYLNADQTKVNKIYIVDIGLTEDDKNYLGQYHKVKFIEGKKIRHKTDKMAIHSEEWVEAVCQKTIHLRKIIEQSEDETILLFDADTVTIKDFSHFFDEQIPIQLCLRQVKDKKNPYIACFTAFNLQTNKDKILNFVNRWIFLMKQMMKKNYNPPYETLAMNEAVKEFLAKELNIFGDLPEVKVASCGEEWLDDSCVIHLKSKAKKDSPRVNIAKRRIKLVENYSHYKIKSYLRDLTFNN